MIINKCPSKDKKQEIKNNVKTVLRTNVWPPDCGSIILDIESPAVEAIFSPATAAAVAGEKIASTAGLSMSSMIDPQSGGQTLVLSSVLMLFLISCFLSLDGHLFIIKMLLESYLYLPIGIILNFSQVSNIAIDTFGNMLYLAALISLPIVGGLLLIQCSIGIITRSAPSLNLFSFGFPIALISVFIFLYAGVGPISDAFSDLTGTAINLINDVLHSTKKGTF